MYGWMYKSGVVVRFYDIKRSCCLPSACLVNDSYSYHRDQETAGQVIKSGTKLRPEAPVVSAAGGQRPAVKTALEAWAFQQGVMPAVLESPHQRPRLPLLGFRVPSSWCLVPTYPYSMIWRASWVICLLSSHGFTLCWLAWVHRVSAWGTWTHPQIRAVSPRGHSLITAFVVIRCVWRPSGGRCVL